MLKLDGIEALREWSGRELGVSGWMEIPQEEVDVFARVTRDEYWIHTDPKRAESSPFGGTIVHGLFTLSLGPGFCYEIFEVDGFEVAINYGYGRVRFPAPVPVGSRMRMRATLAALEDVPNGLQATYAQQFECEGVERPVCVADLLVRYLGPLA